MTLFLPYITGGEITTNLWQVEGKVDKRKTSEENYKRVTNFKVSNYLDTGEFSKTLVMIIHYIDILESWPPSC